MNFTKEKYIPKKGPIIKWNEDITKCSVGRSQHDLENACRGVINYFVCTSKAPLKHRKKGYGTDKFLYESKGRIFITELLDLAYMEHTDHSLYEAAPYVTEDRLIEEFSDFRYSVKEKMRQKNPDGSTKIMGPIKGGFEFEDNDNEPQCTLYAYIGTIFIDKIQTDCIKVGYTSETRLLTYLDTMKHTHNPRLLGTMIGKGIKREKKYHRALKPFLQTRKEWYRMCPEVIDFVENCFYLEPDYYAKIAKHKQKCCALQNNTW